MTTKQLESQAKTIERQKAIIERQSKTLRGRVDCRDGIFRYGGAMDFVPRQERRIRQGVIMKSKWVLAGTYADAGLPTRATKRESIRDAKAAWGDKIWGLRFVKL